MRSSTAVSLMPPVTHDASVTAEEQTENCMCEQPPPPVLPEVDDTATQCTTPDTCSVATQCDFEADEDTAFKCARFNTVDRLVQGFQDAKRSANAAFAELCSQVNENTQQKEKFANLQQRITTLKTGNEALLKRTLEITEDVSSLKSITANSRHVPVMQKMAWFNIPKLLLLQMPLDKYPDGVPPEYFFDLLNCSHSSTREGIQKICAVFYNFYIQIKLLPSQLLLASLFRLYPTSKQSYWTLFICQYLMVATSLVLSDDKESTVPAKNGTFFYNHLKI